MISNPIAQELIKNLPPLKHFAPGSIYLTRCPFHTGETPSLVIDFEQDGAVCLQCGFGGTTALLRAELGEKQNGQASPLRKRNGGSQNLSIPWDNYGHLVTEEVSQAIHGHLFSSKVKELNSAVEQLAQLVSRMKLWIDSK